MAVSVDSVYQKVLALANKEQRGYITPLEFNLFANQAQLAIFEQYFYDLNQFKRQPADKPSTSDIVELIENKLTEFTTIQSVIGGTTFPSNYRIGRIFANPTGFEQEPRLVSYNELKNIRGSFFHRMELTENVVYVESSANGKDIEVWDELGMMTANVTCEVISIPYKVEWGYDVIAEKALYNATRSINFGLHASEEPSLVIAILKLAGITLNKPGLIQAASQEEANTIQQEKQ
jgi:hypothetical protein